MDEKVKPSTVTLLPSHWATIDAFAKDRGYGSTSAALRRIVDEWQEMKTRNMGITRSEGGARVGQ